MNDPELAALRSFLGFWLAGTIMYLQKVQLLGAVEEIGLVGNDTALKLKLALEAFPEDIRGGSLSFAELR